MFGNIWSNGKCFCTNGGTFNNVTGMCECGANQKYNSETQKCELNFQIDLTSGLTGNNTGGGTLGTRTVSTRGVSSR